MAKTLIVVAGPTAVGKTALAIRLANHYQTEIISADSRQFYREMSIGTAKPVPEELAAAKHHFIDSRSIFEPYSVGDFEREALSLLGELFKTREHIILVGGSGLFVNAVIYGFDALPSGADDMRAQLNNELEEKGLEYLQNRLKELDPVYYSQVDLNNPQRIIRALEVSLCTGKPFSSYRTGERRKRNFNTVLIGLNLPREQLYERINMRVDQMVESGLVAEAERLIGARHLNSLQTVGYSELFEYFNGRISLRQAIEQIKQNTRRFAKRQLTWFRRNENIQWFEPEEADRIIDFIDQQLAKPEYGIGDANDQA